jgi:DAK2 domain fusion protein YloV
MVTFFNVRGEIDLRKRFITLDGSDFYQMIFIGAQKLSDHVDQVNALNVFPVPDGDTGTNMNLTLTYGLEELRNKQDTHIGQAADTLSKGLLMGARGNSGVILSQLFRGFAKSVQDYNEINAVQFAAALQQGVEMAYKAVIKPVEGTILTVATEASRGAAAASQQMNDIEHMMQDILIYGNQALAKTPEQLPILKEAGVVDAGGQGLLFVYEGFMDLLSGKEGNAAVPPKPNQTQSHEVQAHFTTASIEFGYCTEFLVKIAPNQNSLIFEEAIFRQDLSQYGDSLLVVADDDLVKVHIHAEYPGQVMDYAMKYGELTRIKIENMRDQHAHMIRSDEPAHHTVTTEKDFGFVAVGTGDGIEAIFRSLGVDVVLFGGQTMNPSTDDILQAIQQVSAKSIFVLPNNSNIILAAQQAKELIKDRQVIIIPSKTIPQGMAAMVSFNANSDTEANTEYMLSALRHVQSGQVTNAVRDCHMNDLNIQKDDFLGMLNNQIVVSHPDLLSTCKDLITLMLKDGGEIVTLLTGENAVDEVTEQIVSFINQFYPKSEMDVHSGGQPLYPYIISVE